MKVVRYDLYDTAGPSGPLSGTSCPPQPHLEVKRTPPFLTYLEAFLRGDQSMKVVSYDLTYHILFFLLDILFVYIYIYIFFSAS